MSKTTIQALPLDRTARLDNTLMRSSYCAMNGSTVDSELTNTPPSVVVLRVESPLSLHLSHETTLTFGIDSPSNTLSRCMANIEAQEGLLWWSSTSIVNGSTSHVSVDISVPYCTVTRQSKHNNVVLDEPLSMPELQVW
jgi:hypothetical protein